MKKNYCFLAMALSLLLLWGCGIMPEPTEPTESVPEITTAPTEQTKPAVTAPPVTEPLHSALYIPDVSVEDVILYFNEVCLDAEVNHGGDPSLLQKWSTPIYYHITGQYTQEDMDVLEHFTAWLNSIYGFPGIFPAEDEWSANLRIHFGTAEDMLEKLGDWTFGLDGAVTFWYSDDAIYDAIICCRTDLNQYLRNSVILEEIYNGLGPIQDTSLRPDSIIYAEYSEPQSLSAMDELILKLLYHPDLLCGMDAESCEAVIRSLYY